MAKGALPLQPRVDSRQGIVRVRAPAPSAVDILNSTNYVGALCGIGVARSRAIQESRIGNQCATNSSYQILAGSDHAVTTNAASPLRSEFADVVSGCGTCRHKLGALLLAGGARVNACVDSMSSNATPRVHAFYSDSHARVVDRKVWEARSSYDYVC